MAGHEKVIAFQRASELAKVIFKASKAIPSQDISLRNALRDKGMAAPARMAAAIRSGSKKRRIALTDDALEAAVEAEFLLSFAADLGYFKKETAGKLKGMANEVVGLLSDYRQAMNL